jgi:hypothetical protein
MGNKNGGQDALSESEAPGDSEIVIEKILKILLPDHVSILILPPQSRQDHGNVDFDETLILLPNSRKALRDIIQIRARKYFMPKSLSDNRFTYG